MAGGELGLLRPWGVAWRPDWGGPQASLGGASLEPESLPLKAKFSLLRAQGSAQQQEGPEHVTA